MIKTIDSREDVSILVHAFYAKIRKDTEIGHFFNEVIEDWNEHLEKLTNSEEFTKRNTLKKRNNKVSEYEYVEEILKEKLDTKVNISKNKIVISFTNVNDLNRILEIINAINK